METKNKGIKIFFIDKKKSGNVFCFFFLVPRIFTNLENFRKSGSDQVFESQKCIEIEKHVGVYITFIRIVIKKLNFLYQFVIG